MLGQICVQYLSKLNDTKLTRDYFKTYVMIMSPLPYIGVKDKSNSNLLHLSYNV